MTPNYKTCRCQTSKGLQTLLSIFRFFQIRKSCLEFLDFSRFLRLFTNWRLETVVPGLCGCGSVCGFDEDGRDISQGHQQVFPGCWLSVTADPVLLQQQRKIRLKSTQIETFSFLYKESVTYTQQ